MSADSELIQKRQEVLEEILALKDQIPLARIFNTLGKAFKQNSLGYWLSNIILLNLILFSPWTIIGLMLKEFSGMPTNVVVETILTILITALGSIVAHITMQTIFDDIAHQIVEKMNYPAASGRGIAPLKQFKLLDM